MVNYAFVGLTMAATGVAVIALLLILWSLVVNGLGGINLDIFTMDQPPPEAPGAT
jgi:phosphate transport system permease protein